jgi:sugar lactone lactonase YvrE
MRSISAFVVMLMLAAAAPAEQLVLVAGGGEEIENVPATKAKLNQPFGVDFDKAGNMYIVEMTGNRIVKVDQKGILTIVAGTGSKGDSGDNAAGRQATFNGPHSLAVSPYGLVYVADTWNQRVRVIDPKSGVVKPFAGIAGKKGYEGDDGAAIKAKFGGIYCVALDPTGARMVATDLDNRRIRIIDVKTGTVTLAAGNGERGVPKDGADAKTAPLVDPRAACLDRQGNLYILERGGHALRVVDKSGKIRTVIGASGKKGDTGDGGDPRLATMNGPKHLCVDQDDNVIIADTANHVIRKFMPRQNKLIRIAGTGKKGPSGNGGDALQTPLNDPHGVTVHADGTIYISDSSNHRVLQLKR